MFEKLTIIPELEKTDDGYAYPEKYQYNVFEYQDKLVIFTDSVYYLFPLQIVDIIVKHIIEQVSNNIPQTELEEVIQSTDIDKLYEQIGEVQQQISETSSEFECKFEELQSTIGKIIDAKIGEVHNNFMPVIEETITEKIAAIETLNNSNQEGESKKLSLGELFALKETFSSSELVELRNAGLI